MFSKLREINRQISEHDDPKTVERLKILKAKIVDEYVSDTLTWIVYILLGVLTLRLIFHYAVIIGLWGDWSQRLVAGICLTLTTLIIFTQWKK